MTDPTAAIEVWARMLCAADVHVYGAGHPTWQQTGSKIRDDYRKAAAWLLPRLTVAVPAPATDRDTAPTDWIDGHPQLEAIAAAVWEHCQTEGTMSLVVDDPRNIAVAALAAVLPAPTDQTAVRAQAFEDAARMLAGLDPVKAALAGQHAWNDAAGLVRHMAVQERRLAGEAQQNEAGDEGCETGDMRTCTGACPVHGELPEQQPAREAQQDRPLRAELKPWQLLADQPDEPLPQTERAIGGHRLPRPERQDPTQDDCPRCKGSGIDPEDELVPGSSWELPQAPPCRVCAVARPGQPEADHEAQS
ncbi:hypothetical protein ACFZAR_36205 [Streptomyces sp. NPDC008222]|uniref:hypothetical protein n=1 Tax=Streptomyces sp. NPDC008222 TaxID=3364820 RepID=UPI0036EC1F7C